MKSKLIRIIMALTVCLIVACAFAGCQKEHTHEFGDWKVVKEAGCTKSGKEERTCIGCEKKETKVIEPAGHTTGSLISELPATCTSDGVKAHYECTVCNKYLDAEGNEIADLTIAQAGHALGVLKEEVPATCTSDGVKAHYECTVCNKYFDADGNEINNLSIPREHQLNLVHGKEATCTQEGVRDTYFCVRCRLSFDEFGVVVEDKTIPVVPHTYTEYVFEVPATATQDGVKGHMDCSVCGQHFDSDGNVLTSLVIPATEHSFGSWIDEVEATCDSDGTKGHYTCAHCELVFDEGYNVIEDLTIPASHDLVYTAPVEPNCTQKGNIAYYTCSRCTVVLDADMQEVHDTAIDARGHEFGAWNDGVSATCTTNGVKPHKTCSRCNLHFDATDKVVDIVDLAHHDFIVTSEIPATCTTEGVASHKHCQVCDKDFDAFGREITDPSTLTIPAREHAYGILINGIAATCTTTGIKEHYHCRMCDKDFDVAGAELEEIVLAMFGHEPTTQEIIAGKEPTCTTDGWIAHFECNRCGCYYDEYGKTIGDDARILAKSGHEVNGWNSKNPTCTESGIKLHCICGKCDESFYEYKPYESCSDEDLYISPLGHNYVHIEMLPATCENDGRAEYYQCSQCSISFYTDKETVIEDVSTLDIEHTGHIYGDLITGTPATETECGTIDHYTCTVCAKHFDSNNNSVETIYIPMTVHTFGNWDMGYPANCTENGMIGHYECSHCNKYFDIDYREITTGLEIPPSHNVGELVPVRHGKCYEEDICIPYYHCEDCDCYLDENYVVKTYDDIFKNFYRHNLDVATEGYGEDSHMAMCLDCGYTCSEEHTLTYETNIVDGIKFSRNRCTACGYETELMYHYKEETSIETISDFYIGYYYSSANIVRVTYSDYTSDEMSVFKFMSSKEAQRYESLVRSLAESMDENSIPVVESFRITLGGIEQDITITFRPYIVYGVKTSQNAYQKGYLNSVRDDIKYIVDSNYSRDTRNTVEAWGNVINDGGFDPAFDFEANATDCKEYTVKYSFETNTYDVVVKYVNHVVPTFFSHNDVDESFLGSPRYIDLYYSDGSFRQYNLEDIVVEGEFDINKLGLQTVIVEVDGLRDEICTLVLDPQSVVTMYPVDRTIDLGSPLCMRVIRRDGSIGDIEVTDDMLLSICAFDNEVLGTQKVQFVFEGILYEFDDITVRDPFDTRVESIDLRNGDTIIWDVVDGNIVADTSNLYIIVRKMNGDSEFVKVTESMISYDADLANEAMQNGTTFTLTISYYGVTVQTKVYPSSFSNFNASWIDVYDSTKLEDHACYRIDMQDGDLSRYFVDVYTMGYRYALSLTKDMIFVNENGEYHQFDFDKAQNGSVYPVVIKYGDATKELDLVVFTADDVSFSIQFNGDYTCVVGTKDEVLAQLVGRTLELFEYACGYQIRRTNIYFEDLIVASNENADYSKPGAVTLTVSYMGKVDTVTVSLVPDLDGVNKATYAIDWRKLTVFENGYTLFDNNWGTWQVINQELNLYQIASYNGDVDYICIDGETATVCRAEVLAENREEYTMYSVNGMCNVIVYTKDGLSLADIYAYDYTYRQTVRVTFSADGKKAIVYDIEYTIGEDNHLEIIPEGNVVYRYSYSQDGMFLRLTFNDNGKYYLTFAEYAEDGTIVEDTILLSGDWVEKDGYVTAYSNGSVMVEGVIVDGYLVMSY